MRRREERRKERGGRKGKREQQVTGKGGRFKKVFNSLKLWKRSG